MPARGYLYILLAAVMWGSPRPRGPLCVLPGRRAPGGSLLALRALSFVPFAFQALRSGRGLRIERGDRLAVGGFAVVCVAAFYGVYQLAIQSGGAALASVLMYTAPAWVAIMAWAVLGERMSAAKLCAVAATLAGVAGVSGVLGADSTVTFPALVFGLLSGVTYAAYYIFGKRLQPKYSTPQLFIYSLPLGALILLPFVDFHTKTLGAWAAIGTVAMLSTWGAYTAYFAGLRQVEATRASVVATIEPVVAAVTAYLWWGERFTAGGYLGSLLILGAVGLMVWDGAQARRCRDRAHCGRAWTMNPGPLPEHTPCFFRPFPILEQTPPTKAGRTRRHPAHYARSRCAGPPDTRAFHTDNEPPCLNKSRHPQAAARPTPSPGASCGCSSVRPRGRSPPPAAKPGANTAGPRSWP